MVDKKNILRKINLSSFLLILIPIFSSTLIYADSTTYEVAFEELAHLATTGGDTFDSIVVGDLAYIIDMNAGLLIYNVSDSSNPELLDTYYDGGIPHAHFIDGELLYLADHYHGLEIYNISNPREIVKLGQIADTGDGETDGVFVSDNIAYTAEWHDSTWNWKMVLINVSDPTSPERISEYTDGDNEFIRFYVENDICFTACLLSGFKILNVSNPNGIIEIGSYVSGGYVYDMEIRENIAFVGDGSLNIINITDLSNPTSIIYYYPNQTVFSVEVQEDLVFIGLDEYGVQAINVSILTDPYKIGEYRTDDVIGLELSNNILYLAQHEFGFRILEYNIKEVTDSADFPGIIFAMSTIILLTLLVIRKRK